MITFGQKAKCTWTVVEEEEEAGEIWFALWIWPWFPIAVGLECCTGSEGLLACSTSLGSHIPTGVGWAQERRSALACVRNKRGGRGLGLEGMGREGGRFSPRLCHGAVARSSGCSHEWQGLGTRLPMVRREKSMNLDQPSPREV